MTLIEKIVIARVHSVILTLKFWSHDFDTAALYQRIREYAVIFSQNSIPFLKFLLSNSLILHNMICIIWANKRFHIEANIKLFGFISKSKCLKNFCWLKNNNSFYKNVVINRNVLNQWNDKFILSKIADRVLQQNKLDVFEKKNYVVNLESENYKNYFYYVFNKFELKQFPIFNDCLYIDANDIKKIRIWNWCLLFINIKKRKNRLNRLIYLSLLTKAKIVWIF